MSQGGRRRGTGGRGNGRAGENRRSARKGSLSQRGAGSKRGTGSVPRGEGLKVRVKTAKRRSLSSTRWLERQLNDPYVSEARRLGYRSRAAFKLAQLDDRFGFLSAGARVVDLGCAPGGWLQVAAERCGAKGRLVGIDLSEVEPVEGAILLVGDFLDDDAPARLQAALSGPADVVLSDMAAASTGHPKTDHLRVMALAEAAFDFACSILAPEGWFVAKVLQGGTERELLNNLRQSFRKVRHVKPEASRSDSSEMYLVAEGFRGAMENETS